MDEENKDLPIYVDKVDTYEEETTKIDGNSLPEIPEKVIKKKTTYVRVVDRIECLYNVIEKIIDHQIEIEGQSGVNMKIRVRKHLEGWDFRDLAADNDPYKPHVATFQTIGNGWVDFTRAIRATTLFGRGFGEIIKLSNTIFCSRWRALPKHGYYLAVCVSDLKEIMLQHEGDVTAIPRKLTRDITWQSPDTAFEPCKCRGQTLGDHSEFAQVPIPSRLNQKLSSKQNTTTLYHGGVVTTRTSTLSFQIKLNTCLVDFSRTFAHGSLTCDPHAPLSICCCQPLRNLQYMATAQNRCFGLNLPLLPYPLFYAS
jgi:hypothetical protein